MEAGNLIPKPWVEVLSGEQFVECSRHVDAVPGAWSPIEIDFGIPKLTLDLP